MRSEDRILDEYLAASARAGDRSAFDALARRWGGRLVAHAWRLTGDADLAQDAAQSAWSDIVRGLRGLNDSAAFPAFAYRIVTRRAVDAIRKAGRRRRFEAAYAAERPISTEGDDVETAADGKSVARAIRLLPPEQRAALALFYLEDLSVAEIAVALDAPAGTVKTRLMAAREKLRAAFGIGKETANEQA